MYGPQAKSDGIPTAPVDNTTTVTNINTSSTSSNWTSSLLSTVFPSSTKTPVDDKLLSTDGDIALIILAAIFFLTTIGLIVVIFKLKYKQRRPTASSGHHPTKDHGASNDAYGLSEPEQNTPAMYYDVQIETVTPDADNMHDLDYYGNQKVADNQLRIAENQFADNEVYG